MKCQTCLAWHVEIDKHSHMPKDIGTCRAEPPKVFSPGAFLSVWPTTHKDGWCMKHVPKMER